MENFQCANANQVKITSRIGRSFDLKKIVLLSIILIISGGTSCILALSMPKTQEIVQEGSVVLVGETRAEFIVPFKVEGREVSIVGLFDSLPGEDFMVYLTLPEESGFSDAENITCFFNGTGGSIRYLDNDFSTCCTMLGSGFNHTDASVHRSSGEWGDWESDTAEIIVFGYNVTSGTFPTTPRIVNYTIISYNPVPGMSTVMIIALLVGGVVIVIGIFLIVGTRAPAGSRPYEVEKKKNS